MPAKNLTEAEFYKGYFREIFAGAIQADEGKSSKQITQRVTRYTLVSPNETY